MFSNEILETFGFSVTLNVTMIPLPVLSTEEETSLKNPIFSIFLTLRLILKGLIGSPFLMVICGRMFWVSIWVFP